MKHNMLYILVLLCGCAKKPHARYTQQYVAADQNTVESYILKCATFYEQNRYYKAIANCTYAIPYADNDGKVHAYEIRGNAYDKAIMDYTQVLVLTSDSSTKAEAYYQRGYMHYSKQQNNNAIANYTQALALATDSSTKAKAYSERGWAYYNKRQYDNAIADYTRVVVLAIDTGIKAEAYYERGWLHFNEQRYDNAVADYTQAIRLFGDNQYKAFAYAIRRSAYLHMDQPGRTLDELLAAIRLYAFDQNSALPGITEPMRLLQQPIQLFTDSSKVRMYLARGIAYTVKKHYIKAQTEFAQAIGLADEPLLQADLHQVRGNVYQALGKTGQARKDYAEAKRLYEE